MNVCPPHLLGWSSQEEELRRLLAAEQWSDLETVARAWLAQKDEPEAAAALAYALVALRRLDEASDSIDHWLQRFPDEPRLLALRSEICLQEGQYSEALRHAERAVLLAPQESAVWVALAEACDSTGQTLAAEEAFLAALTCGQQTAPVFRTLEFAKRRHRISAIIDALRSVERQRPLFPAEASCLGLLLYEAGEAKLAASALRYAVGTCDDLPPSLLASAADVIAEAGDGEEALDLYSRAASLRPDDADLTFKKVMLLRDLERSADALQELDRLLPTLAPNRLGYAYAIKAHLHSRQGEHREALNALQLFDAAPGEKTFAELAMVINLEAYASGDASRLLTRATAVGRAAARLPRCPLLLRREDGRSASRLRIGLLSNGFGRHPVGWLTLPAFEALDRSRIELICFSTYERPSDPLANRFRLTSDEYVVLQGKSVAEATNDILRRSVDVLIDLQGYSEHSMPELIVRKPAPIVVKWVGMQAYTYGLEAIDAMLADDLEVPPHLEKFYTEKIIRLDGSYICYLPPEEPPPVGALPFDRNGFITFGFFNNLQKMTDDWLAATRQIMTATPRSRLLVKTRGLSHSGARERFKRRLAEQGIDLNRVTLADKTSHGQHLIAIGEVDIALDSFPYTGGLTTLECALMGVPVVSVYGTSFASRHSLSHLSRLGLSDLCVPNVSNFVSRAVALAADVPRLRRLRGELRNRLMGLSGLCDGQRVARSLEAALNNLLSSVDERRPQAIYQPITNVTSTITADIIREAIALRAEVLRHHSDVFVPTLCTSEDSLRILVALLTKFRPMKLLQLGSSLLSPIIGQMREALGVSKLVLVDDQSTSQQEIAKFLSRLTSVELVSLPTAPSCVSGLSGSFYDAIVERCSNHAPFDAVIIDAGLEVGSPITRELEMIGSMLRRLLRHGSMIILDDALGERQQQVATLWLKEGLVGPWNIVDCDRAVGYGYLTNA